MKNDSDSSRSHQIKVAKSVEESPVLSHPSQDSEDSATRKTRTTNFMAEIQSGPLPSPQLLAEYEKVVPGLAMNIVNQAKVEGDFRRERTKDFHRIQEQDLIADRQERKRGQVFALIFCLTTLGSATAIAWFGHPGSAVAVACLAAAGIVCSFITGRTKSAEPSDQPSEIDESPSETSIDT